MHGRHMARHANVSLRGCCAVGGDDISHDDVCPVPRLHMESRRMPLPPWQPHAFSAVLGTVALPAAGVELSDCWLYMLCRVSASTGTQVRFAAAITVLPPSLWLLTRDPPLPCVLFDACTARRPPNGRRECSFSSDLSVSSLSVL